MSQSIKETQTNMAYRWFLGFERKELKEIKESTTDQGRILSESIANWTWEGPVKHKNSLSRVSFLIKKPTQRPKGFGM